MTEAALRIVNRMPTPLARMYLQAMKSDFNARQRAMRDIQKQANLYRKMAVRHDLKIADRFLAEFLQYTSASSLDALVRQEERKYENELKAFEKRRDELAERYRKLSQVGKDEQRLLSGTSGMEEEDWLRLAYGVTRFGAKKSPTNFSDDNSPAAYRGLLLATGADDDFFQRVVDELEVDVDDLYEIFYNNPGAFDRELSRIVTRAQPIYAEDLVEASRSNNKSQLVDDIVASEFGTALRSYIKTQMIADMADAELQGMSKTIDQLKSGGKIADFAFTQVMQDGWNRTVRSFAQAKGLNFADAEAELRSMINSENLVDPNTAAKAVAVVGDNPEALSSVLNAQDPEKQRLMLDQYINQALQNQVDPQGAAIANYFQQLKTLPQDPSFALWRRQNGVDSTGPVSLAEAQRYRRQAARAASPLYRHKRTGDVRLVKAVDTDYAVDTSVGALFFANDDGEYLRPEQVEQMAAEDLKEARYAEFDLSNDDLRARVFAAIADPKMRKALAVVEKQRGFTDRARLIYDKDEGRFVVLDGDKRVRFQGRIDEEQQGSILVVAEDPQLADPVGSAAGYQANTPQNYLQDDEFDVMFMAPAGEQVDAAAAYLPARMAEPPVTTFYGEKVYTPGQDPGEFQFLVVGPDGRKQVRKVQAYDPVTGRQQLFEARTLEMNDLDAYNRRTGSDLNERQFARMLRGPLLGRGRKGRDERQARRARVRSGDELSSARKIEPRTFPDPLEATNLTDGTPEPETPTFAEDTRSVGGSDGDVERLRITPEDGAADVSLGTSTPTLSTVRPFTMNIASAIRGETGAEYSQNPIWALAQQADYARALTASGLVPPGETPSEGFDKIFTEQGTEVDDEDEKQKSRSSAGQ